MLPLRGYVELPVNRSVAVVLIKPSLACVIWVIRYSRAAII